MTLKAGVCLVISTPAPAPDSADILADVHRAEEKYRLDRLERWYKGRSTLAMVQGHLRFWLERLVRADGSTSVSRAAEDRIKYWYRKARELKGALEALRQGLLEDGFDPETDTPSGAIFSEVCDDSEEDDIFSPPACRAPPSSPVSVLSRSEAGAHTSV